MSDRAPLRLGTRASALATTQSGQVAARITELTGVEVQLVTVSTEGDRNQAPLTQIGGTGVFVAALREALLADGSDGPIRATVLERSTQTNEVGRLATLAPAFAIVAAQHDDAPLSLLEVGASAGLCLYPDRYTYRWRTEGGDVVVGAGPGLACDVTGPAPLPQRVPRVAARRGIDLNPLDVTSPDDVAWLETLVWPEHDDRRARLRAALEVARADPPHVVAGDLLTELPRLVEEAAADGPVVVLHSAVIPYLDDHQRGPRARTHAALARLTHLPPPDLETSLGSRTPLRSCP